jgi:uracil-DNA glycosylase family 4
MAGEDSGMGGEVDSIGFAEARSALAWWLDAGVDVAVQEEPRDWLKPAAPRPSIARPAAPATIAEPPNVTQPSHETLADLQQWLAGTMQLPLAGDSVKRILPHGPENAAIMLLSDAPAIEDAGAGQPIGGDAWTLAQRMLSAIGISAEQAYSASLSCFHAPGSQLSEAERKACAEVARQQIRLAKPQRLLLFGDGPCLALLGKRLLQARGHVHRVEGVRAVATFHPRSLINQPSNKAYAWKDLLLLMENES